MDGSSISPIDRLKYRGINWLLEKLYERPAGELLAEGAIPASVLAMDNLFANRPLAAFLPYEVFTDDGLYKTINGQKLKEARTIFSFAFRLKVTQRLQPAQAAALAEAIEEALPVGYVLQVMNARLQGDEGQYTSLVCITAEDNKPRQDVLALRDTFDQLFDEYDVGAECLQPDALMQFMAQAFDKAPAGEYDDHELIGYQCALTGIKVTTKCVELQDQEGETFRELYLYTPRCYGQNGVTPFFAVFPALINDLHFIAQFTGRRTEAGFEGQFVFGEFVNPGQASQAPNIFSGSGWLVERDAYNTHLSLLSLFPMTVSDSLADSMMQFRRWRPFGAKHLQAILPLPFTANEHAAGVTADVVTLKKEASYV